MFFPRRIPLIVFRYMNLIEYAVKASMMIDE